MSDANKALVTQLFDSINNGNLGAIDTLLADDFVEHEELPPGMPTGKAGVNALFGMLRGAFPDFHIDVEHLVAEGDLVSAYVVMKGTHQGEFMGIPATGKTIAVNVSDLIRFRDGKGVEHWGVMDMAGMMQQLGVMP